MQHISTADSAVVRYMPETASVAVNKIPVPEIPVKEIVRKASPLSISIAFVLLTLFLGFWLNAASIVAIISAPDRLQRLEEAVKHCHDDKVRLETEIQELRVEVTALEKEIARKNL